MAASKGKKEWNSCHIPCRWYRCSEENDIKARWQHTQHLSYDPGEETSRIGDKNSVWIPEPEEGTLSFILALDLFCVGVRRLIHDQKFKPIWYLITDRNLPLYLIFRASMPVCLCASQTFMILQAMFSLFLHSISAYLEQTRNPTHKAPEANKNREISEKITSLLLNTTSSPNTPTLLS